LPSTLLSWTNLQILGQFVGLGIHLFVTVSGPGDNEGTFSVFESSCYLLLPV